MAKTIAIINQKGGVGKSTTAQALQAGFSLKGLRCLLIDMDAQGNTSDTMRADREKPSVLDVITGQCKAREAVQHLEGCGDIIPGSAGLAGADAFLNQTGKEYKLREALEDLQQDYDVILLDTPPALGVLTVNALTACSTVVIPAQADIYSLQGIQQLTATLEPIRKYCNPGLTVAGILLTRYSNRSTLSREVAAAAQDLAGAIGTKVFKTTIREAVAVKEAQVQRQTLFQYAPKAKVTEDYMQFLEELQEVIA